MAAELATVCDAVVSAIRSAQLPMPVTVERHYRPQYELADMEDTRVTVVPRRVESEAESRGAHEFEYQIDVAVQKRLSTGTNAEIDALVGLTEEIAEVFRGKRLTGYPKALCIRVACDPIYAPEHLEELRQFTSVMTLTFRAEG